MLNANISSVLTEANKLTCYTLLGELSWVSENVMRSSQKENQYVAANTDIVVDRHK